MKVNSIIIRTGTFAWPVSLTSKRPATIKPKPNELPNKRRCAVVFELVWHQKSNIPIKMQPTPIFFLRAIPTLIACSLSEMLGNIAKVNNSGKNQNAMPKSIIIIPLNASVNLEFLIYLIYLCIRNNVPGTLKNTVTSSILQKLTFYYVANCYKE